MKPELTEQQRQMLDENDGVFLGNSFVIMSLDMYRETMGVRSDEELALSVAALKKSMEEARSGDTRLLKDALDDLSHKYEVSS